MSKDDDDLSKLDEKTQAVFNKKGYTIQKKLNEGAFGQVYQGTNTHTDKPVAIKVMFIDKLGKTYTNKFWPRELKALVNLSHPHIIEIYDIFKSAGKLFIFMQFANGGDISGFLKKTGAMQEPLACYWFTQTSKAVNYMHTNAKMAHRDIKIDNVLLHNNRCKLTDFGFAVLATDDEGYVIMSTTFCGTAPYYSPQIVNKTKYNPFAADVYAMGVMLFCMLNNKFPYHYEDKKEQFKEQTSEDYIKTRYAKNFPDDLRDLQEKFFEPIESKRITMAKVLEHEWIVRKGKLEHRT